MSEPPNTFPREDVLLIGKTLTEAGILVAGFTPAPAGLCDPGSIIFEQTVHQADFYFLPDRKFVSQIAHVALGESLDEPRRLAASLMAFAQCLHINFEPALAFHELAHASGNALTHLELRAFRAADQPRAREWLDLALGRAKTLQAFAGALPSFHYPDLAIPLQRWARNYVLALKVAELELLHIAPLDKALGLLDWMNAEFVVGSPAFLLASLHFAPNRPLRMLKGIRSPSPQRTLDGVRVAAWDFTYVSDFMRRVRTSLADGGKKRFILATADTQLAQIAGSLFQFGAESDDMEMLATRLARWWPAPQALQLAAAFCRCMARLNDGSRRMNEPGTDMIAGLSGIPEGQLLDWQPARPRK